MLRVDLPQPVRDACQAYAALERDVQAVNTAFCGDVCALCTSTCCTPDICEESLQSPFLFQVRTCVDRDAVFNDRFGWLSERGCALCTGRPPVCYGFFCNEIIDALPESRRQIVRVLGRLLSWVGERASGGRHIVEISDAAALAQLNVARFHGRLDVARTALAGVTQWLRGAAVASRERRAMQTILSAQLNA